MTKSEGEAFEQLLAYIRDNYRPIGDNLYNLELDEEFNILVFRVNPKARFLYELDPFLGVFV
jgi:hypothetical protein